MFTKGRIAVAGSVLDPQKPGRLLVLFLVVLGLTSGDGQAQNLITNGDFDTSAGGWSPASGTLSHDDTEGATSGAGALSIQTFNDQSTARQCVTGIKPDTAYDYGAAFRVASNDLLNVCRMQIEQYDSGSCAGSPVLGGDQAVEQTIVGQSASYTSLASSFTTEAGTDALRVSLTCFENFPTHTVKWDDVFLTEDTPEIRTFTLAAGLADAHFHMPGLNGLVGDGDDVISAEPTPLQGSDPNYRGAFSFLVEQVPNLGTEAGLPDGFNRVRYLEGTIDIAGTTIVDASLRLTGGRQGIGLEVVNGTDLLDGLTGDIQVFEAPFTTSRGIDPDLLKLLEIGSRLEALAAVLAVFQGETVLDGVLVLADFTFFAYLLPIDASETRSPSDSETLRGSAPSSDLRTTKSVDVAGLTSPSTTVNFTVDVTNDGPDAATGVLLRDRLPTEATYVGNDCGASAPTGNLFSWSIGDLSLDATATCNVTMTIDGLTNFDFHNAAIAYGEQLDPDLDNNASEVRVQVLDDWVEGIDQRPDQQNGFLSDLSCTSCPTGNQAIADAFKVNDTVEVCGVHFFGGYTGAVPTSDDFTFTIHEDNRQTPGLPGVPGAAIATLEGGLLARFPTGNQITGGFDEYSYSKIRIEPTVALPRGRYWLVITNDTGLVRGANTDWFWSSGDRDIVDRGFPGVAFNPAFADNSPGWGPNFTSDLAFNLCLVGVDPPDLSEIFADGFESGDTQRWQ